MKRINNTTPSATGSKHQSAAHADEQGSTRARTSAGPHHQAPETGVQRIDFSGCYAAAKADGQKTATTGHRAALR